MQQGSNTSEAEIRLMGLILAQSALVGLAIGLFDADMWLNTNDPLVNGFTYAMAAFFVQGIAYYFFKMFFEQNMQERVRIQNMERERQGRYRSMQYQFDNRRAEMELRMQEAQLEAELNWMEKNPGKMPPSWGMRAVLLHLCNNRKTNSLAIHQSILLRLKHPSTLASSRTRMFHSRKTARRTSDSRMIEW